MARLEEVVERFASKHENLVENFVVRVDVRQERSGERELALDLLRTRGRRHDLRHHVLHCIRRGREFARHVARVAMHSWITAVIKSHLKPAHEIRNQQANRVVRANVLAT